MISTALAALESPLRQAAARRDYAGVQRLAAHIGAAAAAEVRELPAGDPRLREMAAWLKQVLESTEILVRIGRAAQADEFRRVLFLKRYLPGRDREASRVRVRV